MCDIVIMRGSHCFQLLGLILVGQKIKISKFIKMENFIQRINDMSNTQTRSENNDLKIEFFKFLILIQC
jgi:hypothetical protein